MKVVRGAGDTVRSIIISANSRLALLENPQILRILSKDDLHIEELGIGTKRNRKKKNSTVLCNTRFRQVIQLFGWNALYTAISGTLLSG